MNGPSPHEPQRAPAIAGWLSFAASLVCSTTASSAAPPPIEISWSAPEGCPSEDAVRGEIHRLVRGVQKPAPPTKRVTANATVSREGKGLSLVIVVDADGVTGTRRLQSTSCDDLADAAAMIVALAYDPELALLPSPPAPKPPIPEPPAPKRVIEPRAERAPPVQEPPPPVPAAARVVPVVGLNGIAEVGALPSATAGGSVQIDILYGRLRAGIDAGLFVTRQATVDARGRGASIDFQSLGVRGCGLLFDESLELSGCGRLELGRMYAQGFGVDRPGEDTAAWVALGPTVLASLPVGERLATSLELGALFALSRPEWRLTGVGALPDPGLVAGRAAVGIEIRF